MLWCSGAISSMCIPASYVLTSLPITFTTDVHGQIWCCTYTCLSRACHCMWCTGMLHSLDCTGSLTSCHVRSRSGCYQLWSTGSQLFMHPVCHSDSLFVSTGCGTPSAVPTHAYTPIVLSPSLGIPWTCGTLHRTLLLGQVDPCCSGAGRGAAEGGTLKTLSVFHAYSHYMHGACSGHTVAPWSTCMAVSIGGETLCMCPHSECPTSMYGKCCLPGHHLLLTRLCWCRCATGCTVMCWHHEA